MPGKRDCFRKILLLYNLITASATYLFACIVAQFDFNEENRYFTAF